MVTMVGNEDNIKDLVTNLIYLEHDAIAAYDSCGERLDDETLRARIAEFKSDPFNISRSCAGSRAKLEPKRPLRAT
jgi:hypothetical protein